MELIKFLMIIINILFYNKTDNFIDVKATVYNPVKAQCNSEYWITANGKKIDTLNPYKHRWVAISRDLEKLNFKLNDTILVKDTKKYDGKWVIQDRMNKRKKKQIDFLVGKDQGLDKWNSIKIRKI